MRGGRNKFGPMYKYDRALRQQALRQRQLLMSHGIHQPHDFFNDPLGTPPDVKPDILQLAGTSRTLHEPSRTPADVGSSHGEFYRRDGDPVQTLPSVASYQVHPSPVSQYPYSSRQHHHDGDRNTSASFCDMTSPVTPLAGLSHMMNDVPNFVAGQSPSSRLLPRNFRPQSFPATVQSRAYIGHPSCPPAPPYQFPAIRPPEEFRRNPSVVLPPSSFRAVLRESASPFTVHEPLQSSDVTVSQEHAASSQIRASQCKVDMRSSPVSTHSGASSQPCLRVLSDFMAELRRNEPNQCDVQKKLSSVFLAAVEEQRQRPQLSTVDSPATDEDRTGPLRPAMEVVCKMCDQMLFMMVEWARGARFFRELKVHTHIHGSFSHSTKLVGYPLMQNQKPWLTDAVLMIADIALLMHTF